MLSTKLTKYSTLYLIAGATLLGCQSQKPVPVAEIPQFPSTTYPMLVTGKVFQIDVPWNTQQSLQQQQDAIFTSANEYDANGESIHRYVKVEKVSEDESRYILKSGMQVHSPEHDFDTFLQYTLSTSCKQMQTTLQCQYKAIDALYSVDLPASMSLKAEQTPAQMEQNEIATLTKLSTHTLKVTDKFKTSIPLSTLKSKLAKRKFLVDTKKPNLYLSRLQYNYEVELTQEKIQQQYEINVNYYINPTNIDAYHADYAKPLELAKKDFDRAINQ